MFMSEGLEKKWGAVLDVAGLPAITDKHKRAVTAIILENQAKALSGDAQILNEVALNATGGGLTGTATATGPMAGYDPILISLVRRSLTNLIAYDICGVQPMTGPTGLIFAMRSNYSTQAGQRNDEAFYNEANTGFTGNVTAQSALSLTASGNTADVFTIGAGLRIGGMTTTVAEGLGDGGQAFAEMGFSIEKVTVTARTRALKAEYTLELAQDLKAVHGLDAETELSNILSAEVLSEINREVIRTIYSVAKIGCQVGTTAAGTFDLDTDSNGRWMVEKIKGLVFQIEREANTIAKQTRRGKGNVVVCSSDVASAFALAGVLDYAGALKDNVALNVDDTGNTFAGTLLGRYKVYIDPYFPAAQTQEFAVVGYKGSNAFDAGIFYCPYVPLQMVRAIDTATFQPKIGFKTRYGLVANPFAEGGVQGSGALTARANMYYRAMKIANIA